MPKKAFKKKKAHKLACYRKARQGLMNIASGAFINIGSANQDGMTAGYKAGYRIH